MTVGGADEANNQLYVAGLTASHVGDQGAWRHLSGLLGRDALLRLDRRSEPADAAEGIKILRLAGDDKAIKQAIRRLADDGPASAVTLAASEVTLEHSTRTTVFADLALLQYGGDLLDEATAKRAVDGLVAMLDDPTHFLSLSSSRGFSVEATVVECLRGIVTAVPRLGVAVAVDRITRIAGEEASLASAEWARLLYALPDDAFTAHDARTLAGRQYTGDAGLQAAVRGIVARFDADAHEQLLADARDGSLDALGNLGPVDAVPEDAVGPVIAKLTSELRQLREDVRRGTLGMGYDVAGALAQLLAHHHDDAGVDELLSFLADDAVPRTSKRATLHRIMANFDLLADRMREPLRAVVVTVADQRSAMEDPFAGDPDIAGEALCLAAMIDADDAETVPARFAALLAGPPRHRRLAAHLAGYLAAEPYVGALAALGADDIPDVRAAAARRLANLVTGARGGPVAEAALRRAASDPGRSVPLAIASALADAPSQTDTTRDILAALSVHPSATVRRWVAAALGA